MIELKEEHFIGEGKERLCFLHPDHKNICIKISKSSRNRKYEENEKEYMYFNKYLKKMSGSLPISEPVKWVNTNLGRGLMYHLIRDFDGSISKSIYTLITENELSVKQAALEMESLKQEFCEKRISPIDLNPRNILLQKLSHNKHRLVLIDGYGINNIIPVVHLSKIFGKKHIIRRFDRHITQLKNSSEFILQPAN